MPEQTELDKKIEMVLRDFDSKNHVMVATRIEGLYEATKDVHKLIQQEKEAVEKAYGGCKKCYGKGYATRRHGLTGSDDFGGEGFTDPAKTHMVFCSCDRGKQLESLSLQKGNG